LDSWRFRKASLIVLISATGHTISSCHRISVLAFEPSHFVYTHDTADDLQFSEMRLRFGSYLEHLNICPFFINAGILFSPLSMLTSSRKITTACIRSFYHFSLLVLFGHLQDGTPAGEKEDHLSEVSQFQTLPSTSNTRHSARLDSKPSSLFLSITKSPRCSLQPDSQPFLILLDHHTLNSLHHDGMSQAITYSRRFLKFGSLVAPVARTSGI
jgi:hypothetical protein